MPGKSNIRTSLVSPSLAVGLMLAAAGVLACGQGQHGDNVKLDDPASTRSAIDRDLDSEAIRSLICGRYAQADENADRGDCIDNAVIRVTEETTSDLYGSLEDCSALVVGMKTTFEYGSLSASNPGSCILSRRWDARLHTFGWSAVCDFGNIGDRGALVLSKIADALASSSQEDAVTDAYNAIGDDYEDLLMLKTTFADLADRNAALEPSVGDVLDRLSDNPAGTYSWITEEDTHYELKYKGNLIGYVVMIHNSDNGETANGTGVVLTLDANAALLSEGHW